MYQHVWLPFRFFRWVCVGVRGRAQMPWKLQFPCWIFVYCHSFACVANILINFSDSFHSVSLYPYFPPPSLTSSAFLHPLSGNWSFLSVNFGSFYPAFYILVSLSSVVEELWSFWGSHVTLLYVTCVCVVVCPSIGKSSGFIWEFCWAARLVPTPLREKERILGSDFCIPSLP